MFRKEVLAVGVWIGAQLSMPALAQEVEAPSELDVTLTVVEETEQARDLLNNIELPPDTREFVEEKMADLMTAVSAAQNGDAKSREDIEVMMQEAMTRSLEMADNARLSADAASEEAQRAAEVAREAVEEAVKNALSGADIQGVIEQMMQDILSNLPDDIRNEMDLDIDAIIERARQNLPDDSGG
ncbi:hypothetical protein [Microbulbifer magnicolonia]|uniref:hypothetical protein n=1 Tax=Microbulbifer magnicolonia TaxID=3109744 RepID=UPI002B402D4B|nr:hypothetical protein [Microbulbifer sp. GG15]